MSILQIKNQQLRDVKTRASSHTARRDQALGSRLEAPFSEGSCFSAAWCRAAAVPDSVPSCHTKHRGAAVLLNGDHDPDVLRTKPRKDARRGTAPYSPHGPHPSKIALPRPAGTSVPLSPRSNSELILCGAESARDQRETPRTSREVAADLRGRRRVSAWAQPGTPQRRHRVRPQLPPDPAPPPAAAAGTGASCAATLPPSGRADRLAQKLVVSSRFPELKLRFGDIWGLSPRPVSASRGHVTRFFGGE